MSITTPREPTDAWNIQTVYSPIHAKPLDIWVHRHTQVYQNQAEKLAREVIYFVTVRMLVTQSVAREASAARDLPDPRSDFKTRHSTPGCLLGTETTSGGQVNLFHIDDDIHLRIAFGRLNVTDRSV